MTAWGVVAVCGIGGGVAGPFLDALARYVHRPVTASAALHVGPDAGTVDGGAVDAAAGDAVARQVDAALPPLPPVIPVTALSPGVAEPDVHTPSRRAALLERGAVTLILAAACVLAAVRLGAVPQLAAYCVLAGALMVVSVTDLRTGLVPRRFVYAAAPLVAVALLAASASDGTWRPMLDALLGAVVAFVVFALVWWISPKAMGFGDVRLAGLCGGALGWLGLAPAYVGFLAAFVAGTLVGVALLLAHGRRRFPFAPALALGTMFGVLWGTWLGHLWLHG